MKKALILSAAALGLFAAPLALSPAAQSQIRLDPADLQTDRPAAQPVQFFGQSASQSAMSLDPQRGVLTMAPLLARVTPAVVSINTEVEERRPDARGDDQAEMLERFFGRTPQNRRRGAGLGSGVIVDAKEGLILTNNHVIDGADRIRVTLDDRRQFDAEVVGTDPATDVALLKVDAPRLSALTLADSDDVMVGDYVVAVGNPFGLSSTVTSGIVSALGRDQSSGDRYSDFIQTDAAINPGNSGGALVNSKGELIGINTAIISRSGSSAGIGFAVPTRIVRSVMTQLTEFGEVKRGRIGVMIGNVTPELRDGLGLPGLSGALVSDVVDNSPADKAGLKDGDVVVAFNGEDVDDSSDLRNAVGLLTPGTSADITYLRDSRRRTTRITVEAMEEDRPSLDETDADELPSIESFSGATITDIPSDMELSDGSDGVYVNAVRTGSRADRSGLQRGDVIRRVNRKPVANLKAFERFIDANDGPYALVVERDGRTAYLGIR